MVATKTITLSATSFGWRLPDGTYVPPQNPEPPVGDPWSWTFLGYKPTDAPQPITSQTLVGLSGGWHARKNSQVAWVHSDRGHYFYALDFNPANVPTSGADAGYLPFLKAHQLNGVSIDVSANHSQWEDSCYDDFNDKAWVANCGDNASPPTKNSFAAFRFPELTSFANPGTLGTVDCETFWFKWPGTSAYNCETMMCDPLTGQVFFVSKSDTPQLFAAPATLTARTSGGTQVNAMTQITTGTVISQVNATGGDFTPDGVYLYIRNNNRADQAVGKYLVQRNTGGFVSGISRVTTHAVHSLVAKADGTYHTNECLMVDRDYPTQPYFYIAAEGQDTEIGRIHT